MNSLAARFAKLLRVSTSQELGVRRASRWWYSTEGLDSEKDEERKDDNLDNEDGDILGDKKELHPHGVDPRRGWGFRGVHKAILCGKVGQAPIQKILRNGRTVTIFTIGTGGMFDQRNVGARDLPKPVQWHRIAVHNGSLGAYAVQQLAKNSAVYVEGDIETRVYNDSINGEVKSIPEICVRFDGKIRLIKAGESASKISLDDFRELF